MSAKITSRKSRRTSRVKDSGRVGKKPIVMLLGMHRSGTSLCSHILSTLGVNMAEEIGVNVGNDDGHWERWELVAFHDRILARFNREYSGPLHDLPLPAGWWADPDIAAIRQEMIAYLEPKLARGLFGFKDPRTLRLLPLWQQICDEMNLEPKLVLALRDPAQVARSLQARDGLDPTAGEHRWLVHMADFFRYAGGRDVCLVRYEDWFKDPVAAVEKLRGFLELSWQQSKADLRLMLAEIIKPHLRHDMDVPARRTPARRLYELMLAGNRGKDIQALVSQFLDFQQLERPLQQSLETFHAQAARLPAAEQRVRDMQVMAAELAQARDTILRLEAVRKQGDAMAAQLAEQDALITVLKSEKTRMQALVSDAEKTARSDIAALRENLQTAHEIAANHLAKLAARQEELERMKRRQAQDAAAAAALQGELEALRADHDLTQQVAENLAEAFRAGLREPPEPSFLGAMLHSLVRRWRFES